MYNYLNLNPAKRHTIDCVIRGVAFVTGLDWDTTLLGITAECLKYHDMPEVNYVWASYLRRFGFSRHIIPDTCPACYTVIDFCREHPRGIYLLVIVNYVTGGHVVGVKDGEYYDIWDSGNEVASYYWRKEGSEDMRKDLECLRDMYYDEISNVVKRGTLTPQDNEVACKALSAIKQIYEIHEHEEIEFAEPKYMNNGYSERGRNSEVSRAVRTLEDMRDRAYDNRARQAMSKAVDVLRANE